jgi:hypothetical protein
MIFVRKHFKAAARAFISFTGLCTCQTHSSICKDNDSRTVESNDYEYALKHVIVVMRHGDRAPVSKSIGPNYPNNQEIEDLWSTKLVSGDIEDLLIGIAGKQSTDGNDCIYQGRDVGDKPYGQLTDIGALQLILLGSRLRSAYVGSLLPEIITDEVIYTRSTNFCRTMNSLRSLLVGLYDIKTISDIEKQSFSKILSYPSHFDPMIDGVSTNAKEKEEHRKMLYEKHGIPHGVKDFKIMNEKLKKTLGYPNRVNYHVIREQLVCAHSHGLQFPVGLDESDMIKAYELEMWAAKIMFGDKHYNSHEIGSFMGELRDRMINIESGDALEMMSIYSAHDYTLLPLLIGLSLLPDVFPHYGANLTIEIASKNENFNAVDKIINKTGVISNNTEVSIPGTIIEPKIFYGRLLWNGEEISLPGFEGVR